MATPAPVAFITGASSGIGLALTKHLLSKNWHVFMADLNPPPASELSSFPSPSHHFQHTDVSSWDSQASAFSNCWSIFKRLDFCALNAGIDDRDDIFHSTSNDIVSPPKKPNMKTFEVNLFGPYYGTKLAAHYMALNSALNGQGEGKGGKIVITASDAGLWALPPVPQYTATKHAIVGLSRSLAYSAKEVGVTINALAPSLTPTNLAPHGLLENYPRKALTKMETLLKAFDALARFDEVSKSGWGGKGPNGDIVWAMGEEIYFMGELERIGGQELPKEIQQIWERTYRERNVKFALQNQQQSA